MILFFFFGDFSRVFNKIIKKGQRISTGKERLSRCINQVQIFGKLEVDNCRNMFSSVVSGRKVKLFAGRKNNHHKSTHRSKTTIIHCIVSLI